MSETTPSEEVTVESSEKKLSEDAFQNFIQGKRHMLVQDYGEAVASLAEACQLYTEHFGETALECAEVYFHYGKALFRLFQQQVGIIGNLMSDAESSNDDDQKDSESEEEKEQENAETNDSMSNEENAEENENAEETENDEEDLNDDEEASCEADGEKKESSSTTAPNKSEDVPAKDTSTPPGASEDKLEDSKKETVTDPELEKPGPSKPKAEEEVTDLQLAWENLELAKTIFQKIGDKSKEGQLKVAEVLLLLAEISMELENYDSAVADLEQCLMIRKGLLESDDRLIAETFYQLGLLYTLSSRVSQALENYQMSIDCIKLRIENLRDRTEVLKTPEGWDILPAEEIKELEAVLPDIIGKMEDTKDMVQDTKDLLRKELTNSLQEVHPESSMADKPVTNITHLLKRKKPDDQNAECSSSSKKIKLSTSVVNGEEQAQLASSTSSLPVDNMSNT